MSPAQSTKFVFADRLALYVKLESEVYLYSTTYKNNRKSELLGDEERETRQQKVNEKKNFWNNAGSHFQLSVV